MHREAEAAGDVVARPGRDDPERHLGAGAEVGAEVHHPVAADDDEGVDAARRDGGAALLERAPGVGRAEVEQVDPRGAQEGQRLGADPRPGVLARGRVDDEPQASRHAGRLSGGPGGAWDDGGMRARPAAPRRPAAPPPRGPPRTRRRRRARQGRRGAPGARGGPVRRPRGVGLGRVARRRPRDPGGRRRLRPHPVHLHGGRRLGHRTSSPRSRRGWPTMLVVGAAARPGRRASPSALGRALGIEPGTDRRRVCRGPHQHAGAGRGIRPRRRPVPADGRLLDHLPRRRRRHDGRRGLGAATARGRRAPRGDRPRHGAGRGRRAAHRGRPGHGARPRDRGLPAQAGGRSPDRWSCPTRASRSSAATCVTVVGPPDLLDAVARRLGHVSSHDIVADRARPRLPPHHVVGQAARRPHDRRARPRGPGSARR